MADRIGFIGLGNMGQPMALQVAKAGYDLQVYDIRKESLPPLLSADAKVASAPREIARHADIVQMVVMDDEQVLALTAGPDGIIESCRPGTLIVIHSTVLPETVEKVAAVAAARGVEVIDAPISGGATGALEKTLCYMVGGSQSAFERCKPLFATSGANIIHVGPLGTGAMAKLTNNLMTYVNMLATSEGMRLAEKSGIDIKAFCEVVHASSGQSRVTDNWMQRVSRRKSDPDRPDRLLNLIHKDLRLVLDMGHKLRITLPAAALAQQSIEKIM